MSWQRILETARGRNMPVIVTDIAGREPLVILPLAEYERMGEAPSRKREPTNLPDKQELEAFAEFEAEELQKQVDAAVADLSLEEKFYLEPVEEEPKMP